MTNNNSVETTNVVEKANFNAHGENDLFLKWRFKRYILLAIGMFMLMCVGVCYAWSVLNAPIAAEFTNLKQGELQLTFTIFLISNAICGIASGLLNRKLGTVKINLAIGAVLIFLSFLISSFASGLITLYIGFGVLGGAGVVFVYNSVISNLAKWFKDRMGVAVGVLLMGYGIGSFLIGLLFTAIIGTGAEWRTVYIVFGAVIAGITLVGMIFMSPPPAGYETPEFAPKIDRHPITPVECTPTQMMKRRSFWLLYSMGTFSTICGMGIISSGRNILMFVDPAMTLETVAVWVGLLSVSNALGRIFTGFINDLGGLRFNIVVSASGVTLCTFLLALAVGLGSLPFVLVAFILVGFCAGMSAPDGAVVTRRFFGEKNYQINLQVVMSCGVFNAFGALAVGGIFDSSNGYLLPLLVLGGISILGMLSSIFLRKP